MPVIVRGLGSILYEWRLDQQNTQAEWATCLQAGGLNEQKSIIIAFLDSVEKSDLWTLDTSFGKMDEFLYAMKNAIHRRKQDQSRWNALYCAFNAHYKVRLGLKP